MIRELLSNAILNNKTNGGPIDSETPDVNRIKSDWNDFLSWMDSKGVKGKPELDKEGLGNKYFKQYIKENPNTSLNEKVIPVIRQEYMKLRDDGINSILEGKSVFTLPGVGQLTGDSARKYVDRFMGHILSNEKSNDPNYVGQHLTQTFFPGAKLKIEEDGKQVEEKSLDIYNVQEKNKMFKKIPSKNTPIATVQK